MTPEFSMTIPDIGTVTVYKEIKNKHIIYNLYDENKKSLNDEFFSTLPTQKEVIAYLSHKIEVAILYKDKTWQDNKYIHIPNDIYQSFLENDVDLNAYLHKCLNLPEYQSAYLIVAINTNPEQDNLSRLFQEPEKIEE